MAHKRSGGVNNRDSHGQRRGVKRFAGQFVKSGNIIVRQCGTQIHPGRGVGVGKDYTIYATADGIVEYKRGRNDRKYVSIIPQAGE